MQHNSDTMKTDKMTNMAAAGPSGTISTERRLMASFLCVSTRARIKMATSIQRIMVTSLSPKPARAGFK